MSTSGINTKAPAVKIIEIGDPTVANAGTELLNQDVMQLHKTPLKGRQVIVWLDGAIVAYHTTNLRVRTRPTLHKHLLAYLCFAPTTTGSANGLPIAPDLMLLVPPLASVGFVPEPGWESISVLLRPEELSEHLRLRGRDDQFRVPRDVEALRVGLGIEQNLFTWCKRLIDTAIAQPELFNEGMELRAAAQVDLMETLLETLAATRARAPERSERTKQGHSDIVRLAERFAMANTADRLYVTDLCKATKVSERSLEYAFRSVMGLSPVAYLTRLRLHRVRHALQIAVPGSTTVTTEALNWGFWHFGEFSRAYKDCFAESPSDTLRRNPAVPDRL
jgi:AraC family ethanolamine operon transcriptional activator